MLSGKPYGSKFINVSFKHRYRKTVVVKGVIDIVRDCYPHHCLPISLPFHFTLVNEDFDPSIAPPGETATGHEIEPHF